MAGAINGQIGLIIPTLNAGQGWGNCLAAVSNQTLKLHRCLVVDSSSTDDTVALATAAHFEIKQIQREEFNHGGTRQWAVEYLNDCEIVVFLTQDSILATPDSLLHLVTCFENDEVALAYGRQLPREMASPIESHARLFNYTEHTVYKNLSIAKKLGTKTFFCSNSFAAYRRSTLLELGGFRRDLILEEDAEYAARAVMAGYTNVYCASASVYHSHDYSTWAQLSRYFDLGAFDSQNAWMQHAFGSHTGEGLRFVKSEFQYLSKHAWTEIPRGWAQTLAKFLGYKLGRIEKRLPIGIKRRISMTPRFWR